jgi:hypothetical protein
MRCTLVPNFGSGYVPPPDYTLDDFAFVNLGGGNEIVIGPDSYLPEMNFRTIVGSGDITVSTVDDTVVVSYTASTATPALTDLNDTNLDNVQVDDLIKWDGAAWVRRPPDVLPDLSLYSFLTLDDHVDSLALSRRLVAGENVSFTAGDGTLVISAALEPGAVPQNAQAGNYTLLATDSGAHIYKGGGGAATYTIPSNASVPYALGTVLTFVNDDPDTLNITINDDTLVLSPDGTTGVRTLGQYGMATALKVGTTRWMISGTNLT